MRKRFVTLLVLWCLITIGTKGARAQQANRFEVEIPFRFVLQDRELPAGKYSIERIEPAKPNLLMLRNKDAHIVRLVLTHRTQKESPGSMTYLLFKRQDEKLYLFQVWVTGTMNGLEIPLPAEHEKLTPGTDRAAFVRLNAKTP